MYENWLHVAPLLACLRDLHNHLSRDSIFHLLPTIRNFVSDYDLKANGIILIRLDAFCNTKFAQSVIKTASFRSVPIAAAATASAAAVATTL